MGIKDCLDGLRGIEFHAIHRDVAEHNDDPKSVRWTQSGDVILDKLDQTTPTA